jgi:uncharacterized protein (TIGR00369 family)
LKNLQDRINADLCLEELKAAQHTDCVVCSPSHVGGLQLEFTTRENGSVEAEFGCRRAFQGYNGLLHGGVIASLLDGAMTNCLFAHGQAAYTAELTVRFLHPVVIGESVTVRAWIDGSRTHLNILKGEVVQAGEVMATAVGKFLKRKPG